MLRTPAPNLPRAASPIKSTHSDSLESSPEYLWYSKHSQLRKVPAFDLNQYDRMHDSIPYKLSISNFTHLKTGRKDKRSEAYIKVTALLVSKFKKCSLSNSQNFLVGVDIDQKGALKVSQPGIVYYHSRINRTNKDVALLLEFTFVERLRQNHNSYSLGYALLDPFVDVHENVGQVKRGNWIKNQQDSTGGQFKYSINFTVELKNLVRLVPQNTIVNCDQPIVCLVGDRLPNTVKRVDIVLSRSFTLRIKGFQIVLGNKFQAQLKAAIEKTKENFCRDDRSNKVSIRKRMLRFGFHNGWTMVSDDSRELELQKQGKKDSSRLKVVDRMKEEGGELQVEIWRDVEGVFICGMIYEVELQGKDYRQVMQFEASVFFKAFSSKQRYGQLEDTMMIGPGFGIEGTVLKLSVQQPLINFEYVIEERSYRNLQSTSSPIRETSKNYPYSSKQFINTSKDRVRVYQEDYMRAEEEKMQLEQNLNLLKSMHEIKEAEKAKLASQLQHERQQYLQAQQMLQNNVTELTKDQVSMQYQIKELQEKLRLVEVQRQQEKKQREEEAKTAFLEKQKLAQVERNNYNKPGNKVFVKNKREAEISSLLYDVLEKKFITPIIKNSDVVDASEYQQYKVASKFVINFLSVRWDQPRAIYIVVRFFNIGGLKTSNIKQSALDSGEGKLIKESLGSSQMEMQAMYQFLIDPSLSANPQRLQMDLVNYLFNKNLILDVYDAQTHFYLGQLNFGLRDTLRGKRDRVISVKQHLLVSDGKPVCSLHIMITNQLVECRRQGSLTRVRMMEGTNNRVLSTAPLIIPDSSKNKMLEGALRESITREDRRLERIKIAKQRKLLDNSNKDNLDPKDKEELLSQIQQYKKQNKSEFIKQVYQQFMNDHKQISCYFGKAEVFSYTFTNTEPRTTEFRVTIQDPDEGQFSVPELSLVTKPLEWRHYCEAQSYQFPKSFECISQTNTFKLAPNESLELLFKFVTYRRMSAYGEQTQLQERMLNVLVINTSNNSVSSGFSLKVEPHEQVIDRSLILYENADEPVQIIVPLLNQPPKSSIVKPFLISTFVQSTVSWLSEYELSIKVQSLPTMNRLIFNVILYENQYMDAIKQNWRVELNSYEGISLVCKQSAPVKFRLAIPQQFCNRRVFLYTSSPEVSFLSDVSNGMFTAENSATVISAQAVNPSNEKKSILVHLVDSESRALRYGWKLNILPWNFRNTFL